MPSCKHSAADEACAWAWLARHAFASSREMTGDHGASTRKVGENQIFYYNQRGIPTEDAVNMIVSGFCKDVFRELPMEFAVEAQKLLGVSLEGSVG